jgi:hypothetical protein
VEEEKKDPKWAAYFLPSRLDFQTFFRRNSAQRPQKATLLLLFAHENLLWSNHHNLALLENYCESLRPTLPHHQAAETEKMESEEDRQLSGSKQISKIAYLKVWKALLILMMKIKSWW